VPTPTPPLRERRIGELARELGLSARTLRYWEELTLLPPADRSQGGYRLYGDEHRDAARGIERLKAAGLSLDEISNLARLLGRSGTALSGVGAVDQAIRLRIQGLERAIAFQQELVVELRNSLARLSFCNGCDGKPYDGSCIHCLDHSEHSDLPPALTSLLRAALTAPTRPEQR
jgi:DNA-binding transcriptional MerR regulator